MLQINVQKITLNTKKMFLIANAVSSDSVKSNLEEEAKDLLKTALPKIPYNIYGKGKHLRDLYTVSKPLKKTIRLQGEKFQSVAFRIKPHGKFKIYYAVVTSGKRLGKTLRYSSSGAESYPLEKLYKSRRNMMTQKFIQRILREINRIHDS